jgi:hypothetical protein
VALSASAGREARRAERHHLLPPGREDLQKKLLLDISKPMRARLREAAEEWARRGKPPALLLGSFAYFATICWVQTNNFTPDNPDFDGEISDYVKASYEA